MSAAPIPQPPRRPKHDICKVPLSYFTNLLEILNPAERACFGLVLNLTIGMGAIGKAQTWARIRREQFAEVARVDDEYVMDKVKSLIAAGWIQEKYQDGDPKRPLYAISPQLAAEAKGEKIRGRCKECKSVGSFSTEFIPMPRSFFTVITPALKNAPFLVLAAISRYSHDRAWTAADGLIPKQVELERNDFERLIDLDAVSISNGIKTLVEENLIEVVRRSGKASFYRTLPENWANLGKKKLRLVTPRKSEGKEQETQEPKPKQETPEKVPVPNTIESGSYRYAFCPTCQHVVELEAIPDDLHIPEVVTPDNQVPKQPPRAGPRPEKKPVSREEAMWDQLRKWSTQRTILKP